MPQYSLEDLQAKINKPAWFGLHEEAIAACDEMRAAYPYNTWAWHQKAVYLRLLGRGQAVLAALDKLIRLEPYNGQNQRDKGDTLFLLGRYEGAVSAYDEAIRLRLTQVYPYKWKGEPSKWKVMGKARVTVAYPETWPWLGKGKALARAGRLEEALAAYDRAIVLEPDQAEGWYSAGSTLLKLGRFEEALRAIDQALELEPDDCATWEALREALAGLGKSDELRHWLCWALHLESDFELNDVARTYVERVLREMGIDPKECGT